MTWKEENTKIKYKNKAIVICNKCRTTYFYKFHDLITLDITCKECGDMCLVCAVPKSMKPPGFARKCKRCISKFICGSTRLEELSPTMMATIKFTME